MMHDQNPFNPVVDEKNFLQESLKFLSEVETPSIAAELIDIIHLRLLRSHTKEKDLMFHLDEVEQANEAPTAENLLPEQSSIYQMMKQISAVDLRKVQQEDVEMSAFDESQPSSKYERLVSEGFLRQSVANNFDVQAKLLRLVN
jgi:hypothetical protein